VPAGPAQPVRIRPPLPSPPHPPPGGPAASAWKWQPAQRGVQVVTTIQTGLGRMGSVCIAGVSGVSPGRGRRRFRGSSVLARSVGGGSRMHRRDRALPPARLSRQGLPREIVPEGQRRGRRSRSRAMIRTAARDRLRLTRFARRRVSSWSSSASASKYSFTNIGCMMPPLCRPVASCSARGHEPGRKYMIIAETAGRSFTHRPGEGLCEGGNMDREDLRLTARRAVR
jgi:hypothetical protein